MRSRHHSNHFWIKPWQNIPSGLCKSLFLQEWALCIKEFKHSSHLCLKKQGFACSRTTHTTAQRWGSTHKKARWDVQGTNPVSLMAQWTSKFTAPSPSVKPEGTSCYSTASKSLPFVCLKDFFKPKLLAGHDSGTIGFPIETQNKIWISKYSPKLMRIICHKSARANLTLQGISVGRTLSAEGTPAVNTDHPLPVHEQCCGSTGLQEGKLPSFPKGNKETTCMQLKWWESHNILVMPVSHDVFQSRIATQARNSLALG